MNYEIFIDMSADIDPQFVQKYNLKYVPMEYVLGEETFYSEGPETEDAMRNFYEKLRQKVNTQTSQITPYHYVEVFEPYVKKKQPIVYLSLSSGLSKTYESAQLAVQMLKETYEEVPIEVVDSLGATGGIGVLAQAACEKREAGMDYKENAAWLREYRHYIRYFFVVDDLMYLKRGGRVSSAAAMMGTALNLKPVLHIASDGTLDTIAKKRGMRLAMKYLVEQFEANFDPDAPKIIYICHADSSNVDALKEMILAVHPEMQIYTTMLCPIIGAHTGPDMISLVHVGKTPR